MGLLHTRPRIALVVDNPYRDLPGLVLTAWNLCQRGAKVILVPMNLRNSELRVIHPDFVLLNFLRTINEDLAQWLNSNKIAVGVLDTEGSVFFPMPKSANAITNTGDETKDEILPEFEEYALSMARNQLVRHGIQRMCAWTPEFADYAVKSNWYKDSQIAVTGTPRSDFYASQWRPAALKISDYVDDHGQSLILINGNFALANPKFQTPETEIQLMIDSYSYDESFIRQWAESQRKAMFGLMDIANALAERLPHATIVIRPHPFENEETYHKHIHKRENLKVIKIGTVDGWLLRAKAVIHWGSSTAVDACALQLPSFVPAWLPNHLSIPSLDPLNIRVPDLQTLIKNIDQVLQGTFVIPETVREYLPAALSKVFYKLDGESHHRVAEAIWSSLPPRSFKPKLFLNRKITKLKQKFFRRHRPPQTLSVDWDRSDKRFRPADVEKILKAISACQPESKYSRIKVTEAREAGVYGYHYPEGRSLVLEGLPLP